MQRTERKSFLHILNDENKKVNVIEYTSSIVFLYYFLIQTDRLLFMMIFNLSKLNEM